MNAEWLPDWWVQSAVCQWLMHGGRMLVPTVVHIATFAIEFGMPRLQRKLPEEQRAKAERSVRVLIVIHLLLFVAGMAALDMGVSYTASAVVWGLLISALASRSLRQTKHLPEPPEKPDPYARHLQPDFAKLRADKLPERTP